MSEKVLECVVQRPSLFYTNTHTHAHTQYAVQNINLARLLFVTFFYYYYFLALKHAYFWTVITTLSCKSDFKFIKLCTLHLNACMLATDIKI